MLGLNQPKKKCQQAVIDYISLGEYEVQIVDGKAMEIDGISLDRLPKKDAAKIRKAARAMTHR